MAEGNIKLYHEENKGPGATYNEISKFKDIVETIMQYKQDTIQQKVQYDKT